MADQGGPELVTNFVAVGEDLALDFLNTVILQDGERLDLLHSDKRVLDWLDCFGVDRSRAPRKQWNDGDLLKSARRLRETVRAAVLERKAGQTVRLAPLNLFLRKGSSHRCMRQHTDDTLSIERQWSQQTPEGLLAPIAEAAAVLLATADFTLVRKCESANCVLWFIDKTKSHHRRWCSAAGCGNRAKVAAYRSRLRAETA